MVDEQTGPPRVNTAGDQCGQWSNLFVGHVSPPPPPPVNSTSLLGPQPAPSLAASQPHSLLPFASFIPSTHSLTHLLTHSLYAASMRIQTILLHRPLFPRLLAMKCSRKEDEMNRPSFFHSTYHRLRHTCSVKGIAT